MTTPNHTTDAAREAGHVVIRTPYTQIQVCSCGKLATDCPAQRKSIAVSLRESWLWSKQQPIGNFGSFKARNAFIRNAAYVL